MQSKSMKLHFQMPVQGCLLDSGGYKEVEIDFNRFIRVGILNWAIFLFPKHSEQVL